MDDVKKPKHPAIGVVFMFLAGLGIIAGGVWAFTCGCDSGVIGDEWCSSIKKHPPWTAISGLATIPAIILTWIWREQHKRKSETHAEAQIAVAQDGQVTERFTRAIEQLGSEKLAVRLGAIYALERIAKDSSRDHWTIMETLSAFVRTNTEFNGEDGNRADRGDHVPEDIQAALTVIARRNVVNDGDGNVINLSEIDLSRADFKRANLENAWLAMTDFVDSPFADANLAGAHLEDASFSGANLRNTKLMGAFLWGTFFTKTRLKGADLTGATGLTREQLVKAIIYHNTKLPPEFEDMIPPAPIKKEDA